MEATPHTPWTTSDAASPLAAIASDNGQRFTQGKVQAARVTLAAVVCKTFKDGSVSSVTVVAEMWLLSFKLLRECLVWAAQRHLGQLMDDRSAKAKARGSQ